MQKAGPLALPGEVSLRNEIARLTGRSEKVAAALTSRSPARPPTRSGGSHSRSFGRAPTPWSRRITGVTPGVGWTSRGCGVAGTSRDWALMLVTSRSGERNHRSLPRPGRCML